MTIPTIPTLSASEVRTVARQYVKDLPVQFKDGVELWGVATGGVPHHREWWLLKGDEILGHLNQGSYDDPRSAKNRRMAWALQLGVVHSVLEKVASFQYDWIPVEDSNWKGYL